MSTLSLVCVMLLHAYAALAAARRADWPNALLLAGFTAADAGLVWLNARRT